MLPRSVTLAAVLAFAPVLQACGASSGGDSKADAQLLAAIPAHPNLQPLDGKALAADPNCRFTLSASGQELNWQCGDPDNGTGDGGSIFAALSDDTLSKVRQGVHCTKRDSDSVCLAVKGHVEFQAYMKDGEAAARKRLAALVEQVNHPQGSIRPSAQVGNDKMSCSDFLALTPQERMSVVRPLLQAHGIKQTQETWVGWERTVVGKCQADAQFGADDGSGTETKIGKYLDPDSYLPDTADPAAGPAQPL